MYEKPEITLVGSAVNIVLGEVFEGDDNDAIPQLGIAGCPQGLDE